MLLERERELSQLTALSDAVCKGAGHAVLIEGRPGIGKSALLAQQVRLAKEQQMRVLAARGGTLERDFAFGVVRQLFEPAVASLARKEREALFSGAAGLAAPLFQPDGALAKPAAGGDIFPLLHGLYWLAAALAATRPCLIAVDDAHWADAPSLRWLDYVVRRLEDLSVLIVMCVRSTAPEAPAPFIDVIRDEPGVTVLRPTPLSESAAAAVLEEVFDQTPDAQFTRASHQASGGNPFLLTELARALAAEGSRPDALTAAVVRDVRPEAIARGVLVRLGHLAPEAQALARAMAVLDSDAEVHIAGKLAQLSEAEAGQAADALAASGLLEPHRPLRFMHPLIRSVIYGDLATSERAQAHRRAAEILAEMSAPVERAVAHLLLTEPSSDGWVVAQLRAAAATAYARGASEAATDYLRRALAEPPSADALPAVLLELGGAETANALPEAAEHLISAFHLAGEPALRADAAEAATPVLLSAGRTHETLDLLETAIGELGSKDPERTLELETLVVAAGMLDPSGIDAATETMHRVAGRLEGRTCSERMMLCHLAYHRMWRGEDAATAADLARRAAGGGLLIAERGVQPHELTGPLMAFVCADELESASELLDAAEADARARGSEVAFSFVRCMRAEVALRRGALRDVATEANAALEVTMRSGLLVGSAVNASLLIAVVIECGELDRGDELLARIGFPGDAPIPPPLPFNHLLYARGRLRLAQGKLDAGVADLTECGLRNKRFGLVNPVFIPWRIDLAFAYRAVGDLAQARALADTELEVARAWGTPGALGAAERLAALVAALDASEVAGLRRAVELSARAPARLEQARALTDLGAALRRSNLRNEARGPLQLGLDLAERCGATLLADRCRTELLATGARPRRFVLRGIESLTASERRVATLAAQGLSNPEIAQALFVTRKTVETHLGHVYEKLDIRSREELPALVAQG